jgi:PAS domain S-box-containing protein
MKSGSSKPTSIEPALRALPLNADIWGAGILAIAIFLVDTFSPLQTAVAVFYVAAILLIANSRPQYVFVTSCICATLTIVSYLISHGLSEPGAPFIRAVVSLSAIGITSILALRNRAAEITLREQANLLELTHDAVFVRDLDDAITYWNRGAEVLYGWLRHEAIGQQAHRLLQTKYPEPRKQIYASFLRHGRWEGELVQTAKNGAQVVVASRWSLQVDDSGRPAAVLDTNTDVTAHTQTQEALNDTRVALAHAGRVATLGELTASIAHEINQPLTGIVTNGEAALRWLSRDQPDVSEASAAVARVISDGRRASEVILRIRGLSRKGEPSRIRLDLNEAIRESLVLMQPELLSRGIAVLKDLAADLPPVEADRIQMQQVLINLIMNAIQAMDTMPRDQRRLKLRSFSDGSGNVSITVQDNGPGIDDETERKLFNAFFTTKPGGMGIGLSVCRSIVEAHGGRISLNRDEGPRGEGRGATFQVTIPSSSRT